MMSLTMMGLTKDPLVRALFLVFLCVLTDSVGRFNCLGSGVFSPTGVESKCGIFLFAVFVPKGVKSKGVQLIEIFWRPNSLFSFQI